MPDRRHPFARLSGGAQTDGQVTPRAADRHAGKHNRLPRSGSSVGAFGDLFPVFTPLVGTAIKRAG
jgi:hypothetical protein